jgi:Uncharacterized conserved protein
MKNLYAILLVLCFAYSNAQEHQRYINVNGTSELVLTADQINFTVKIRLIDSSVEKSKISNDKCLNELSAILKNIGINSNEMQVSPITLGKNYEFIEREHKQKGFYTEVIVSFLLKDISKYYELTNKLATNDAFEITNSDYSISNYELQHRLAYEKALIAAKEKAEYMSKALGTNLGEVIEIEENNYWQNYSSTTNSISVEKSTSSNISGKVTIRRSVRVKYSLK